MMEIIEELGYAFQRQTAGYVASVMPSHAISNTEQTEFRHNQKVIFVQFAYPSLIRDAEIFNVLMSPGKIALCFFHLCLFGCTDPASGRSSPYH